MELSKEQCVQLDNILKAFDRDDNISRDVLLDMFDQNDQLAYSYVHILVNKNLVSETGKTIGSDLPLMIFKEPPANIFMANGGFEELYEKAAAKIIGDNQLQKIQKENLELQNENLAYQQTIREQENRIRSYDEQNKLLEVIKNYWWLIAGAFTVGGGIAKYLL